MTVLTGSLWSDGSLGAPSAGEYRHLRRFAAFLAVAALFALRLSVVFPRAAWSHCLAQGRWRRDVHEAHLVERQDDQVQGAGLG